jgi:hypothetical protein
MSSVRGFLLTVVLVATIGAATGGAGAESTTAGERPRVSLTAFLSGSQEVPPADPNAWGVANLRVGVTSGQICYTLFVRRVDGTVGSAHLHSGGRGVNGAVKATLATSVHGWSQGCVNVGAALAADLTARPGSYYVNVHSSAFADGALRGQLRGPRQH